MCLFGRSRPRYQRNCAARSLLRYVWIQWRNMFLIVNDYDDGNRNRGFTCCMQPGTNNCLGVDHRIPQIVSTVTDASVEAIRQGRTSWSQKRKRKNCYMLFSRIFFGFEGNGADHPPLPVCVLSVFRSAFQCPDMTVNEYTGRLGQAWRQASLLFVSSTSNFLTVVRKFTPHACPCIKWNESNFSKRVPPRMPFVFVDCNVWIPSFLFLLCNATLWRTN